MEAVVQTGHWAYAMESSVFIETVSGIKIICRCFLFSCRANETLILFLHLILYNRATWNKINNTLACDGYTVMI